MHTLLTMIANAKSIVKPSDVEVAQAGARGGGRLRRASQKKASVQRLTRVRGHRRECSNTVIANAEMSKATLGLPSPRTVTIIVVELKTERECPCVDNGQV